MKRLSLLFALVISPLVLAGGGEVAYPEGYRDWTHVKSMLIEEGHPLYGAFGGLHHIYANKKGMAGYRSGKFADGATIVFDLLSVERGDAAVTEGPRKVLGVMHKNSERYAETGGWGFEGFAGGDRNERVVGAGGGEACFACHVPQKERDYVFSQLRD